MKTKKVIAFGPEKDVPSWNWVGFDTSRELAKYYEIKTFDGLRLPPRCDVCFLIKQLPSQEFIRRCKAHGTKIVYCPIDFFYSEKHLHQSFHLLREMAAAVTHCERLEPLLRNYCRQVHYVDHNNRFALPEMAPYKENGFVLWVGGCQYLAYLLQWASTVANPPEIKILTDIDNGRAVGATNALAAKLGIGLKIQMGDAAVGDMEIYPWSERLQAELMRDCKAAIDIKGEDFNQLHKPVTKAQKYIASGIPFAVNRKSYAHEYFIRRGFQVVTPENPKWFTYEYWEATQKYGKKLREQTSIEAVGKRFQEIIEKL